MEPQINAITEYNGSGHYEFLLTIAGTQWAGSETGAYNGGTAEEIAERTTDDSGNVTPLLNFQSITITGYNGRGLSALPGSAEQITMPGYDSLSGVSNGSFTATQNHCNG